jgi:hypothetical protein
LRLTGEQDPLALPVIAAHYHSDADGRMSLDMRDPNFEQESLGYVRARAAERHS